MGVPGKFSFEALLSYNEVLATYIQYLGLLARINLDWPHEWKVPMEWVCLLLPSLIPKVKLFNFDLAVDLPNVPRMDFRAYYLLVVVFIPLVASFVLLLFFKPIIVCLWYLLTLVSISCLIGGIQKLFLNSLAGAVTMFLPNVAAESGVEGSAKALLITGGVLLFVCLVAMMIYWGKSRRQVVAAENENEEEAELKFSLALYHELHVPPRSLRAHITKLVWFLGFLLIGLFFIGEVGGGPRDVGDGNENNPMFSIFPIIGRLLLVLAGCTFALWIFTLFDKGRRIVELAKLFLLSKFVRVMLFMLTVLYIPLTTSILSAFNCIEMTCSEGYHFPSIETRLATRTQIFSKEEDACEKCSFIGTCPFANSLCPQVSDSRLEADVALSCKRIVPYFAPVAAIMLLAIVLGIPLLFYILISQHTKLVRQIPSAEEDHEEQWAFRVTTTGNSAKSLYSQFELNWRFFKVFVIIQKLIVVVLSLFVIRWKLALCIGVCIIHFIFLLVSLYSQPYVSKILDLLSNATSLALAASSVLAVMIAIDISIPLEAVIVIVVANFTFPLIGTFLGWLIMFIKKRRIIKNLEMEEKPPLTPRTLDSIDKSINSYTMKTTSTFGIVVGIMAFLALTVTIIGMLHSRIDSTVFNPVLWDSPHIGEKSEMTKREFANYESWDSFVANCCCMKGSTNYEYTSMELWICKNGKMKERLREYDDGKTHSGLFLREFCSTTFTAETCSAPSYKDGKYQVTPCTPSKHNDYAGEYLW